MKRARRTGDEFESFWDKVEPPELRESTMQHSEASASSRSAEQIRVEIERRLGFFPPHLAPALSSGPLLAQFWDQQLSGYYDNPLPQPFKEKLLLQLSPYCASPYFMIVHACGLNELGIKPRELRELLEKPPLAPSDVERAHELLAKAPRPIKTWPEGDRNFENNVADCSIAVFLGLKGSERSAAELKDILGSERYGFLTALLTGAKASHMWIEGHPEIPYQNHAVVRKHLGEVLRHDPYLEQKFHNYRETSARHLLRLDSRDRLPDSEERYRELFENASDIIYTYDFEGNFVSINRAVERIAGYTRAEALQMKITDLIAPEHAGVAGKMIDPQSAGEMPLNYEVEILSKEKTRIVLGISTRPIFRGGKAVAVQGIARDITRRRKTETDLLQANQKLEAWVTELEQRTREMSLLNEMGDILRACLTTEEAYSVIVRVAQQIFPVQVGALYVIAPSRNVVEAAAVWGDPALVERTFSPPECWALRRGRTHWVENPRSGLICRHIHHQPQEGYLCIPMMAQSEALGVLHLMQPDNIKMTETKQRMAVTMSEHIAMALSNLRLHETLRSQSIRDPLTGLFNRRFMEESLELEIRRAARNQRPLGMIMMDLDHFKYFNDNFGHEAGDLLLKELGAVLKGNIRGEDIACRYGGEEFTIILPEGTGAVTRQRAEFFKEAVQNLDVRFRGRPLGKVTASMGVAVFPDHGRTAKALIEAADKALYRSKSGGRDRITLAG